MSQVIVTHDELDARRKQSAQQEHKISIEVMEHRKMSDPTKPDFVARTVGVLVLPILGVWVVLTFTIFVVTSLFRFILKGLGQVVGGTKSMITGK